MLESVPGLNITNSTAAKDGRYFFDTLYRFYSYLSSSEAEMEEGDDIFLSLMGEKSLTLRPIFEEERYGSHFTCFRIHREDPSKCLYLRMDRDGHDRRLDVGATEDDWQEVKPDYRDLPESLPFHCHDVFLAFRQMAEYWGAKRWQKSYPEG